MRLSNIVIKSMDKPAVNKERILSTFLDLVQIDSPSKEEAEVAHYCAQTLEAAGCTVRFDDTTRVTGSNTGNLFASLPAFEAPPSLPLYVSAHMDTVGPAKGVKPHVKDGYIYSDGTTILGGDDKAGIAAILELIRCLKEGEEQGIAHPEIRILLSVQEECGLVGAKSFDPEEFASAQGALCFVLDAGGAPGLVVNGAPYQYTYRATYSGLASHAGMAPEAGVSAIRAAAKAVAALPQGRIDEQTTTNIGMIEGGTATNIVAAECTITGEIRSHDEARVLALKEDVDTLLTAATQDDLRGSGSAEVSIAWELNYPGFYVAEDAPQVVTALKAAKMIGLPAQTEISGGGADTNILVSYGLAAVSLGTGMDQVHTTDERLALDDLYNLCKLVLEIALQSGYTTSTAACPG